MNKFEKALDFTLGWEVGKGKDGKLRTDGGYNVDTGGPTKWGISKKAHPDLDIEKLSLCDAANIYRVSYWQPMGCETMGTEYAVTVFDTAVNCGVGRTRGWLRAIQDAPGGVKDEVKALITLREQHYFNLKTLDENKYGKYMKGWLARTNDLKKLVDIIREEERQKK